MGQQYRESTGRMEPRRPAEQRQPAGLGLPDHGGRAAPDLIALVEQALELADAAGLTFVSIDLCSALERLKAIADTAPPERCRDRAISRWADTPGQAEHAGPPGKSAADLAQSDRKSL